MADAASADATARAELLAEVVRRVAARVVWSDRAAFDSLVQAAALHVNAARARRGLERVEVGSLY